MKFFKVIDKVSLILLTILLVNDYFPNTFFKNMINKKFYIFLVIGLVLLIFLFKGDRDTNNLEMLKSQLYCTMYLFLLILLLSVLGGQSTSGRALVLISCIDMLFQFKKIRRSDE